MTDNIHFDGHDEEEFEREDLGAKPILVFLVALIVGCVLVALLLKGMYSFLDKYETQHQPAQSPLVQQTTADTRTVERRRHYRNFLSRVSKPTRRRGDQRLSACRKNRHCTAMAGWISRLAWCEFRLTAPWNCWRSADFPPGRKPERLRRRM